MFSPSYCIVSKLSQFLQPCSILLQYEIYYKCGNDSKHNKWLSTTTRGCKRVNVQVIKLNDTGTSKRCNIWCTLWKILEKRQSIITPWFKSINVRIYSIRKKQKLSILILKFKLIFVLSPDAVIHFLYYFILSLIEKCNMFPL